MVGISRGREYVLVDLVAKGFCFQRNGIWLDLLMMAVKI